MSGTSLDGVDAALILTDGETIESFGPTLFCPYKPDERAILRAALGQARAMTDRTERFGALIQAETVVTDVHIRAIGELSTSAAREGIRPMVIGFHGQTVFHAPHLGFTVQIGHAGELARRFHLPVVHDFRSRDMKEGGQGAPLVPVFHRALARRARLETPVAFLNIGGVANITVIGADGDLIAFDTGPGNALIDDAVAAATGQPFDDGGRIAARGKVQLGCLAALMEHPYFAAPIPKSLDRDAFDAACLDELSLADRVATLTAFTARSVAAGLKASGLKVRTLLVAGGGGRNTTLLGMLSAETGCEVKTADHVGFNPDFLEAQAFGYLAVRRLADLTSTLPTTTGARVPVVCGEIAS